MLFSAFTVVSQSVEGVSFPAMESLICDAVSGPNIEDFVLNYMAFWRHDDFISALGHATCSPRDRKDAVLLT